MPFDGFNLTGKNFAPVKPLQDAKATAKDSKRNPSDTSAFFREIYQGLSQDNESGWQELIEQSRVISMLRSGKLTMKSDMAGTGYVFFKPTQSKDRSNYAIFPQNSEILTSKWQKIRPTMNARTFGDGYKSEIQLNSINTLVKCYFRDIFTNDYETREAYSAQDFGIYITKFDYDDELNQMLKIVPVVQNQSKVMVEGYGACYDCQFEGHPTDFEKTGAAMPQCPQCGSYRTTKMVPDAVAEESAITDIETIAQGDITGRLLDVAASRYDPRVFPHESDWFLYSESVPIRLIHKLMGADIELDQTDSDDIGFQVMDALAMRGGTVENLGASDLNRQFDRFTEESPLRSMWLKPAQYAGFKLKKPEDTLGGTIPADVPFEEIFPEGLCVRGFNDMRLQIGIYAEKANIASNVYLYQSHSGIGKGVDSAVDPSRDLNEVFSMAMAGIKKHGASGLAISQDSGLTQQNVRDLFRPEKAVFVDTSQHGGDINKMIMQVTPPTLNPVLPQMMIQLANMVNLAFMTGDFAQGAVQDVDINTFGGQQLAHAKAEEQKGGIFARKVSHRIQSAEILCELHRKHIKYPRWYAHDNDKHGTIRGKWLSGDNLPERIKFDAVPDSEIPENKYEKRLAKGEMIEKAGGIAQFGQAAMADPKLTAWFARDFGVDMPGMNEEEIQIVTLARLAEVKELSEILPDPEQILASLTTKLRVREDAHMLKAEFLQQILDDDEIQTWNPLAIATVEIWIERHYELEAEAQVRSEMIAMNARNQLAMAQQQTANAMMQPQIEAQQQAAEEEALMGMAQEVGGRVLDDEQKQVDHDRQEESAENAHARQMELEAVKAANKPAPAKGQAAKRK